MLDAEQFDTGPKVQSKRRLPLLPPHPSEGHEGHAGCGGSLPADSARVVGKGRFPPWLHRRLPKGGTLWQTGELLHHKQLHTVCEEARCPNLLECWSKKTATFLAMGKTCTRSCGFCSIAFSKTPAELDSQEPERIAESVVALGLKHVVITMVARDDLSDGGAAHLVAIVQAVRAAAPQATVELLTSDLQGCFASLELVLAAKPEIFNHNIETVRSLTPRVRHKATYERTLSLLAYVKKQASGEILIKSGLMLGLGEEQPEVYQTIADLHSVGCDIITMGQYLQSSPRKLPVKAFIPPEQFTDYERYGHSLGIPYMYCGPFIRSSYNAASVLEGVRAKDAK